MPLKLPLKQGSSFSLATRHVQAYRIYAHSVCSFVQLNHRLATYHLQDDTRRETE